jgi:citrate synthase
LSVLDAIAGTVTIADPRIWPLKLTRTVGAMGRCIPAWAAGMLCLDSEAIGPWTTEAVCKDLVAVERLLRRSRPATYAARIEAYFGERKRIIGFGVPFRKVDERVEAIRAQVTRLRRSHLRYWQVAETLWATLRAQRGIEPNVSSAVAAALLDAGFSAQHLPMLTVALTQQTLLANAVEAAQEPAAELRRLPEHMVRYVGPPPRQSPRALAKKRRKR